MLHQANETFEGGLHGLQPPRDYSFVFVFLSSGGILSNYQ